MPIFIVEKSIEIEAPIDKVYASIRDFREWVPWSPWLISEPDCPLDYGEDGKSYSWEGKIIGSGKMEVLNEEAPRSIEYRLSFFKPWKSVNETRFHLSEQGSGTKVSWSMQGSLPFFMFFLKGMMTAWVGMDYDRGLKMMKDYLEKGSVPSKVEFENGKTAEGFSYVGIRSTSHLSEIGSSMERLFGELFAAMEKSGLEAAGAPFSLYHKWKMSKGMAEYTCGVPVKSLPSGLPDTLTSGEVPTATVYAVTHTGPYRHIGNAWSAGMMHAQAKVFAKDKRFQPYEVYLNDPREVAEEDLVTVVNLGVKE